MKISADQIDTKALAGKGSDGEPIVYISSKGGLHCFFRKNKAGGIESLSAAPHKAIAQWMAEQKDPKIEWDEDFQKSEDKIEKSESARFIRFRKVMLNPTILTKSESNPLGRYFVYNVDEQWIEHAAKEDIVKSIEGGKISQFCLVRKCDLTEPLYAVFNHPDFKDVTCSASH